MKTKKGFTLIELLAVIVILAIIALIATPVILNIIEKSRKASFTRSVENVVKTGKTYYMESLMGFQEEGEITFKCNNNECISDKKDEEGNSLKLGIEGNIGTGEVNIDNNGNISLTLESNGYCATKEKDNNKINVEKGKCSTNDSKEITVHPAPTGKSGLIGIVYYNPTNGTECSESEYNTNLQNYINEGNATPTGLKTGCMKWYAYKDNGSTYDMILDHNTTATVAYNSDDDNSTPKEIATALTNDTGSWKVSGRLITQEDIRTITGNMGTSYYYFNGNSSSGQAKDSNAYSWLFDYTQNCEEYGCNVKDSSNHGYWTGSSLAGDLALVWDVGCHGSLSHVNANNLGYGLRPVVTIPKN